MPPSILYCYTYAHRTPFLILGSVYITGAPKGHTVVAAPETRERERVNSKRKRRLTDRQEQRRIEGLRILARIIARHYLANPHLYRNGATPANGQPTDAGEAVREEGGA